MSRLCAALIWFFSDDQNARRAALVVWSAIAAMLTIPVYRRLFGRPRYIDDLFFVAWLLTLNRVCFSVQALWPSDSFANFTRWSGIGAAILYGYTAASYIWPTRIPGLKRAQPDPG